VDKQRVTSNAASPDRRRLGRASRPTPNGRGGRFFGVAIVCLALAVQPSHRTLAQAPCPIPDSIALRDISLPAAKGEVAADQHLIVLTFGGVLPAGADAEATGATFPARLQAALRTALPQIEVTVKNEPPPGKTSADVPAVLPDLIAKTGARLVIWGPGGRDVAAHANLDIFLNAVRDGIGATRGAGADLILLDTTFVPSPARMAMIEGYRQKLLSAAAENHVPLLRRHAMMRLWSENGTLDLAARDKPEQELVARHLFSCVAQGLAAPIAAAVK
jgi:hypothetical protein